MTLYVSLQFLNSLHTISQRDNELSRRGLLLATTNEVSGLPAGREHCGVLSEAFYLDEILRERLH